MNQLKMMEIVHNLCCESCLSKKHPKVKFPKDLTVNSTYPDVVDLVAGLLQCRHDLIYLKNRHHESIDLSRSGVPSFAEVNYYMKKLGEALPEPYHKYIHFSMIWHPDKHIFHIKRLIAAFAQRIMKVKELFCIIPEKQKKLLNLNKQLNASFLAYREETEERQKKKLFIEKINGYIEDAKNRRKNFEERIDEQKDFTTGNYLFADVQEALVRYGTTNDRLQKFEISQILYN